jgi:hypothetical protein
MSPIRTRGQGDITPPTAPAAATGLARLLEDERFVGGLALGAMIGAAIAGSTLWSRLRGRERNAAGPPVVIRPPVAPSS